MAFLTTVRAALRYPNLAQAADIADIVQKLASDVDTSLLIWLPPGTHAARPAASLAGRVYHETDTHSTFLDDGATWRTLGALSLIDIYANRPAGNAVPSGTTFFATDKVVDYVSDGTNWSRKGVPAGHTGIQLGASADPGWILLQGQAWPGTTGIYDDIFGKLGGANLPDFRQYVPVGYKSGDTDFGTLLGTGGSKTHTLTASEMAHNHLVDPDDTLASDGSNKSVASPNAVTSGGVQNVSAAAFSILQPFKTVNFQAKL